MGEFLDEEFSLEVSVVSSLSPKRPGKLDGWKGAILDLDCGGFLGGPIQLGPRHVQPRVQKMQEGEEGKPGGWKSPPGFW